MAINVRILCAAASLLLALLFSAESQAEPHARDRFYLQLATGWAAHRYSATRDYPFDDPSDNETDWQRGPALTGSLLLGLPLFPGFALGAGGLLGAAWTSGHNLTRNGEPIKIEDGGGPYVQIVGIAGPFVDYYPSRRLGLHVQALVGYASIVGGTYNPSTNPSGLGLMAGVGQDWWISDRWSVGCLARVTYASMSLAGETYPGGQGGLPSAHDTVLSPSLEASFTYH